MQISEEDQSRRGSNIFQRVQTWNMLEPWNSVGCFTGFDLLKSSCNVGARDTNGSSLIGPILVPLQFPLLHPISGPVSHHEEMPPRHWQPGWPLFSGEQLAPKRWMVLWLGLPKSCLKMDEPRLLTTGRCPNKHLATRSYNMICFNKPRELWWASQSPFSIGLAQGSWPAEVTEGCCQWGLQWAAVRTIQWKIWSLPT